MNQTTCLGDYKYYETDKLIFCKSTQRTQRHKNGRQSVWRIFFRLSRWNSANFPSAVLVGVFGIVFNCRPHFRSHIHSQCGLFFIKNIGFCIFQQCESKKRIACVIYLCSIVGIIFFVFIILFFSFIFYPSLNKTECQLVAFRLIYILIYYS